MEEIMYAIVETSGPQEAVAQRLTKLLSRAQKGSEGCWECLNAKNAARGTVDEG